jgi:diadenosine tetraphosphate (Ap4A) HIT family hydrolase
MVYQVGPVFAMATNSCPFCTLDDSDRVFHRDGLVAALWDGYPVSPGHALVVPRRHVAGWFDATPDEQAAILHGIEIARAAILERYKPDGFNIGINVGEAAGQTVFHLHAHLIPRYTGDVPDPRGGVRHVVPSKARYWDDAARVEPDGDPE